MVPSLPLERPDLGLVGVLLAVGTSGCARQWSPAVPRDPPVVTSAVVPPAAPMVISSDVSVSDEIATACRLTLARVEDATSRGELDATGTDEEGWKRDRRVDIELQGAFR